MLVASVVAMLAILGLIVWYILFRLRRLRRRYRTLQENAIDAVVVISAEGKLIYASASIFDVLGYSVAQILNMDITSLAHPDDAGPLESVLAEVVARPGVPVRGHTGRMLHGDGSWHWYEAVVTNMLHDRDIKGIVDNFRDVTETVLAQEKTKNANRLYGFISQINQAIVQTTSEDKLFSETCRIATEFGKFKMAWVGVFDSEKTTISIVTGSGVPVRYEERFNRAEILDKGPMFQVLQSGTSYVCNELQDFHHEVLQEFASENGIGSFMVLPLRREAEIIGTLSLYSEATGFFNEQERRLLEEVVSDISFALNALKRERYRKEVEKRLLSSQQRLTQAQSIAHVGSFEIDFSTGLSTWSEELCRIYGFETTNNTHPFNDWFSMVHPEDLEHVQEIAYRAKESLQPSAIYHRIIRQDGSIRHIFSQGEYDLDEDGKPIGMHGVAHDITKIKESERARYQSEQNLQLIMDLIPQGIFIKDIHGRYVFVNESFASLYGVSAEEFLGDAHHQYLNLEGEQDVFSAQDREVILSGESITIPELPFINADGSIRYFYTVKMPYTLSGNLGQGMLGIALEITDQKLDELERTRMMGDLIKRNKELEQFSYVVSHNVRAPLVNIISLISLLHPSGRCEDEEVLLALTESTEKLDSVILDLNFILNMKHELTEAMELVDLLVLVEGIELSIANLIESSGICITTNFSAIGHINCFKSYLHSIFYNLILNSIKYRRQDIKATVHISATLEGGRLVVCFADNGLGIDLSRFGNDLFGLYKRFHPGTEGKGVGLYMVKVQVEQLGGTIAVESEVGVGTTFRISFERLQ